MYTLCHISPCLLITVSGQVPCSGAERRNKVLDEVSTAILSGAAAENKLLYSLYIKLTQKIEIDNKNHIN